MSFRPPFSLGAWIHSWFEKQLPRRKRKLRRRNYRLGSFAMECLEDRALLTTVTLDTSSLGADATAIVIHGTGFDPIVANNSVTFNDGAVGTITAATATELDIIFTTEPDEYFLARVETLTLGAQAA